MQEIDLQGKPHDHKSTDQGINSTLQQTLQKSSDKMKSKTEIRKKNPLQKRQDVICGGATIQYHLCRNNPPPPPHAFSTQTHLATRINTSIFQALLVVLSHTFNSLGV